MVKNWLKGVILGIPIFILIYGLIVTPWTTIAAIIFTAAVLALMDWSGQGDGREGCNLHTTCNH